MPRKSEPEVVGKSENIFLGRPGCALHKFSVLRSRVLSSAKNKIWGKIRDTLELCNTDFD